jgi:hypothetical protein
MGINIPNDVLKITSQLVVRLDLNALEPRQKQSLRRMCKTGYVTGSGIVSKLARAILTEKDLPHVITVNKYYTGWYEVPLDESHPIRAALLASYVASNMEHTNRRPSASVARSVRHDISTYAGFLCNTTPLKTINMKHEFPEEVFLRGVQYDPIKQAFIML